MWDDSTYSLVNGVVLNFLVFSLDSRYPFYTASVSRVLVSKISPNGQVTCLSQEPAKDAGKVTLMWSVPGSVRAWD